MLLIIGKLLQGGAAKIRALATMGGFLVFTTILYRAFAPKQFVCMQAAGTISRLSIGALAAQQATS